MLDSHVFQPENVGVRQQLEQLDLSQGGNGELGAGQSDPGMRVTATYAILFVMHDNLLQGDERARLA